MIKKYWKIITIIVLVLAAAGGAYYQFYFKSQSADQKNINPNMVIEVKKGVLKKTIATEGFVEAAEKGNLSFPVNSSGSTKIKKVYIEEGNEVKEGQLLMELDKTEVKLKYLRKKNAYNRAKINGSKSEIEEAKLDMELAGEDLENTELKAPFAGIITEIYVEEGDYYTSGDVAVVKDTNRLEVEVSIEESDIPDIKKGQKAEVTLESLPGIMITAEVSELEDEADNTGGTVTLPVTVLLDKVEYDIKLGCSADLDIIVGYLENQIIVPITAIFNKNGRDYVMKVEDGKQIPVPVQTGLSNGLKIAVESGLKPGDKILLNTFQQTGSNAENTGFKKPPTGMMMGGKGK